MNEAIEIMVEYRYILMKQKLSMEGQIKKGIDNERVRFRYNIICKKINRIENCLRDMDRR